MLTTIALLMIILCTKMAGKYTKHCSLRTKTDFLFSNNEKLSKGSVTKRRELWLSIFLLMLTVKAPAEGTKYLQSFSLADTEWKAVTRLLLSTLGTWPEAPWKFLTVEGPS